MDITFSDEQRLLRDIARHVGVTAHTVRLTQDLRRLAEDLQRSREQLAELSSHLQTASWRPTGQELQPLPILAVPSEMLR